MSSRSSSSYCHHPQKRLGTFSHGAGGREKQPSLGGGGLAWGGEWEGVLYRKDIKEAPKGGGGVKGRESRSAAMVVVLGGGGAQRDIRRKGRGGDGGRRKARRGPGFGSGK